ncbi:MAG: hypothetical protein GKS01_00445 [Alphaproteobacteria bacterium]|nr:hypothetical protein [Alphaproteobacteria bacterium]
MIICRILGYLLAIIAVAAVGYEAWQAVGNGGWKIITLGELWFTLDAQSLSVSQAGIQRYVAPWLWEPVITTILLWPGWAVFGVPALLLMWVGRKRSKRGRFGG